MQDSVFEARLEELRRLHAAKTDDYGLAIDPLANLRGIEQFGIPAWVGVEVRLEDKRFRIHKAVRAALTGTVPVMSHESLRDSLVDRAVYAILSLQLYDEQQGQRDKRKDDD